MCPFSSHWLHTRVWQAEPPQAAQNNLNFPNVVITSGEEPGAGNCRVNHCQPGLQQLAWFLCAAEHQCHKNQKMHMLQVYMCHHHQLQCYFVSMLVSAVRSIFRCFLLFIIFLRVAAFVIYITQRSTTQHITVRQHNVTHISPAANTGQAWVLLSAKAVQHTQAVPCSLVAGAGWLVPTHLLHLCTLLLVDLLTLLNCCTVLRSSLQG